MTDELVEQPLLSKLAKALYPYTDAQWSAAAAIIPLVQAHDAARIAAVLPALEQLCNHQQQADMDGIFVTVSRQALEEVLEALEARRALQGGTHEAG